MARNENIFTRRAQASKQVSSSKLTVEEQEGKNLKYTVHWVMQCLFVWSATTRLLNLDVINKF